MKQLNELKLLWEHLARSNSKYYIFSDCGKNITDEQFEKSGKKDTEEFVLNDKYIFDTGNKSILEIGCGNGRMTKYICSKFKRVVAIDISRTMIQEAALRLQTVQNVQLLETDGYDFSLIADKSIDIVFSYLVFQHFKDKRMVECNFEEVNRVLKPGGLFKVRLRTDKPKSLEPWWSGVSYGKNSIAELAKKFGFKVLETKGVSNYGIWVWLEKI